jgi:hypothetical protein
MAYSRMIEFQSAVPWAPSGRGGEIAGCSVETIESGEVPGGLRTLHRGLRQCFLHPIKPQTNVGLIAAAERRRRARPFGSALLTDHPPGPEQQPSLFGQNPRQRAAGQAWTRSFGYRPNGASHRRTSLKSQCLTGLVLRPKALILMSQSTRNRDRKAPGIFCFLWPRRLAMTKASA